MFIFGLIVGAAAGVAGAYLSTHPDFRAALFTSLKTESVALHDKLAVGLANLRARIHY